MEQFLKEIVSRFNLTNEHTGNSDIWIGHARIGGKNQPSIEKAKQILTGYFGECLADAGQETPEWIIKTLEQWKDVNPFAHVREKDQPLFAKKSENSIIVAIIWPWQIKRGIASLMLFEGELIDESK